jgi:hypothetical protein
MQGWDRLPVTAALLLAIAAAILSSGPAMRLDAVRYVTEVFVPQTPDLGK